MAGSFLLGTSLSTVPFVSFGTYFAWVYLRFLQYKPELSARYASTQKLSCRSEGLEAPGSKFVFPGCMCEENAFLCAMQG